MWSSAWKTFNAHRAALVGLFGIVFLALSPLPYVLAFEVSLVRSVPLGVQIQVVVPAFAASVAMVVSAAYLATAESDPRPGLAGVWTSLGSRRGTLFAAAGFAALIALVVTMLPFGLLFAWLLVHGVYGPPLVAQAIGAEGLTLKDARDRVRKLLVGSRLQVLLLLVNAVALTGLIALFSIGGVAQLTLDAPRAVRILSASVWQALVLGCVLGFLACLEFAVYRMLTQASTRD